MEENNKMNIQSIQILITLLDYANYRVYKKCIAKPELLY
jgi:hypothetical protein